MEVSSSVILIHTVSDRLALQVKSDCAVACAHGICSWVVCTLINVFGIVFVGVVTHLVGGSAGTADGVLGVAKLNRPYGVSVDSNGAVFVADSSNHKIRRISSAGLSLLRSCFYRF